MRGCFGCAQQSPAVLIDTIKPLLEKHSLRYKIFSRADRDPDAFTESYKGIHIIVFLSLADFNAVLPLLLKKRCLVIVCDSPLLLNEIKSIVPLDYDNTRISYTFQLAPLNRVKLEEGITAFAKGTAAVTKVDRKKIDLLPTIIDRAKSGKFLDKFNTFVLGVTNHSTRNETKRLILAYMFGKISRETFNAQMDSHLPRRGKGLVLFKTMMDFLDGEDGKRYLEAISAAGERPNYTKLAKQFKVDRYELRYLFEARRKTGRTTGPQTMKSLSKELQSSYSKKRAEKEAAAAAAE